jgi:transposase InsO family protein
MNVHSSARITRAGRALLVQRVTQEQWSVAEAAEAAGVSPRTVYKWLARFEAEGAEGLLDRSSRPKRSPTAVPPGWQETILQLRRHRMTGAAIALRLKIPKATVARVLKRHGLERLKKLDPPVPVRRYEKTKPGELVHLDVKKLGRVKGIGHRITGHHAGVHRNRGIGWEFVHVCVDDYTRLAYVEVLENEKGVTTAAFLHRATAWLAEHGVTVERVMTDNGSGYLSKTFRAAVAEIRARHLRTRPYTPRTNGKAERFIQTMLREWAYGRPFQSSYRRRAALPAWLRRYNERRPHAGIGGVAPVTRLRSAA